MSDKEKEKAEAEAAEKELVEHKNKLAALRSEHSEVATVRIGVSRYYFRPPTLAEYQSFNARLDKDDTVIALRELVGMCSVGDDPTALIKKKPAIVKGISVAILAMAGSEVEVTISKD